METYQVQIHLNSGQTLVADVEFAQDLDLDEVVAQIDKQLSERRVDSPFRVLENVGAHHGAISGFAVEAYPTTEVTQS